MKGSILIMSLVGLVAGAQSAELTRRVSGPVDVGDLDLLLPAGVQVALFQLSSNEDFCLRVVVRHIRTDDSSVELPFAECWTAGDFNVSFKIGPAEDDSKLLTFALNDLSGGGVSASATLGIPKIAGWSLNMSSSAELTSELTKIATWVLREETDRAAAEHILELRAAFEDNPQKVQGTAPPVPGG